MARVPTAMRPGAWTPPLARIEGDRLLKARQAEQRVREAQAKVEMEARRVEEMESQKLDEEVKDLRVQLDRLTDDLPKIIPSGGGGKRMVAKVLARDYPDLNVFEGLAKADGNFVVSDGTNWTVESGATARASLGLGTAATTDATDYAAVANNLSDISSAATARTNLGLGSAAVLDSGSASGNLKTLNADGGFTIATTATTTNVSGAFGGTWVTAHRYYSSDAATFSGARSTATFIRNATGSGANGQANADYALHVESTKADYLTSAVQGEIDGLNVVVRQGAVGDVGAILVNAHVVENVTYGLTSFEASAAIVNSAGVKQQDMKVTLGGWLQGATDLRGGGFGFMTRPNDDGYSYDHGILILGYSSVASTGIETAIRCSSTLDAADTYFMVTGDQHAEGPGLVRTLLGSAATPAYSFYNNANTGFYSPSANVVAISTAGTLRMAVGPGVRIGAGLTDPGAGVLNVLTSIQVNGTKVIGTRETGYAGMTGGGNKGVVYDAATITLAQLAARVAVLQASMTTHGLIGA